MAKLTQAEIEKREKNSFLINKQKEFKQCVILYCMSHGYLILSLHDALSCEDDIIKIIHPSIKEMLYVFRLIQDGSRLTSKKREEIIKNIYFIKDLEIKEPHEIVFFYTKYYKTKKYMGTFIIATLAFLFAVPPIGFLLLVITGFMLFRIIKNSLLISQKCYKAISNFMFLSN